jgi:hypothetical protein
MKCQGDMFCQRLSSPLFLCLASTLQPQRFRCRALDELGFERTVIKIQFNSAAKLLLTDHKKFRIALQ